MLNDLLLLSGNDIPFTSAQLTIHQPTVKEIAYVGEESFYTGCEFLKFTKDKLNEEDRNHLENYSNFEVIMSIMKEKNPVVQKNKTCAQMVLSLIFPDATITFENMEIIITEKEAQGKINKNNYEEFLEILNTMFCLKQGAEEYNPEGQYAQRIAEKLRKRHQKLAEDKPSEAKVSILSRYISILTIGQQKDMNSLLNYTIYQLFDEFTRFELYLSYDIYLKAKLAGAKDVKEVDDWMKDIHS